MIIITATLFLLIGYITGALIAGVGRRTLEFEIQILQIQLQKAIDEYEALAKSKQTDTP